MFIRCSRCHGSVWVELNEGAHAAQPECAGCGQTFRLKAKGGPDAARALNLRARRCAVEHTVDLPAAYSILIGLMTLEQARDAASGSAVLHDAGAKPRAEEAAEQTTDSAPGAPPFDPAFVPAVEAGLLTQRQAFERGHRDAFARRVMSRHGVTEDLAYEVADNRISLLAAVRQHESERTRIKRQEIDLRVLDDPESSRSRRRRPAAAALLAAAAALVLVGVAWRSIGTGAGPGSDVEVETNDAGRVVLITAPDAETVLATFCRSGDPAVPTWQPMGLMPSAFGASRVRVGILRDPSDEEKLLAIPIRREREGSRWMAGDGQRPIVAMQAPDDAGVAFAKAP